MVHLPLHAAGLGHVGAEFQAAQRQVGPGLQVVDPLFAQCGRGGQLVVQGIELVAERHDEVFRDIGSDGQLQSDVRIEIVFEPANFAVDDVEVVQRHKRNHAVERGFAVIPDPSIVTIFQAHPAKFRRQRGAFAQQWHVIEAEQPFGIQHALEQLAALLALERITPLLIAILVERRKQAQNAQVFALHETWRVVKQFVK